MPLIVFLVGDMQLGDILPQLGIKFKLLNFIPIKIQNSRLFIQILCANY
jgi:hypothetical protein